ncbi:hypothetical protein [Megalodesulfovibrio paquesii]
MTTTTVSRPNRAAQGTSSSVAETTPVSRTSQPDERPESPPCQYCHLPRHGKPDLHFNGALLGSAREHAEADAPSMRNWWEIALYKTSVGAYLLASTYHVVEEGDRSLSTVISFCKVERLREFFEHHTAPVSDMAQAILLQAAAQDPELRRAFACSPALLRADFSARSQQD